MTCVKKLYAKAAKMKHKQSFNTLAICKSNKMHALSCISSQQLVLAGFIAAVLIHS